MGRIRLHNLRDTGITFVEEVLRKYGDNERGVYNTMMSKKERSSYASYINNHYTNKGVIGKSPSNWLIDRDVDQDFTLIADKLGMTRQVVASYFTTGIRKMRRIIAKNPKKYPDLVEYLDWD